ncbi:MAG: matrixin family metalloprotease [Solirubrobacterales bacterium]
MGGRGGFRSGAHGERHGHAGLHFGCDGLEYAARHPRSTQTKKCDRIDAPAAMAVVERPIGASSPLSNFGPPRRRPAPQCGGCYPWYKGTGSVPAGYVDLLSVATHEFGHTVELTHSTTCDPSCSIMYPTLGAGAQRRNLNAHDYASTRALYAYPAH